jgi:hypothetical protein
LATGCKKSTPEGKADDSSKPSAQKFSPPAPQTVARVHWLGVKKVLADTNGGSWKKIWALPESARLTSHVLDKLALGLVNGYPPMPSNRTNYLELSTNYAAVVATNRAASLLRPLLDDLVQEECVFEARAVTNQPGDFALAIRLDEQRANLWSTNLAALIESATGVRPTPAAAGATGWSCVVSNFSTPLAARSASPLTRHVQLSRSGKWTIVGMAPSNNPLPKDFPGHLPGPVEPSAAAVGTNFWLEVAADPARLSSALSLGWPVPEETPKLWLGVLGQGEEVLTRGRLTLASPLTAELPPWNIPTNLIRDPLHSLTAVRGCGPWISALPFWQNLQAGPAPDQFFTWTQAGSPFLDYFAAPTSNASNLVDLLGARIMSVANPLLATNRMGTIERSTNFHGIEWTRVPIMTPFLRAETSEQGQFLVGGLAPHGLTNSPPPQRTMVELFARTNVLFYDSEITGPRLEAWMHLTQLARLASRRQQLTAEAPTIPWLRVVGPLISPSLTTVTRTAPAELSFQRSSAIGFTAAELHLLADWIESPQFPAGLHSLLLKLPPPRRIATTPGKQ